MNRNLKLLALMTGLVGVGMIASACDLSLPVVDCSGINQPDMGGLVCLGANAIALQVAALILALLLGMAGTAT